MHIVQPNLVLPVPTLIPLPKMISQPQLASGQVNITPTKIPSFQPVLDLLSLAGPTAPINRGAARVTTKI
jgi:hypothetical protein